jgi:ISXO2-like transposase domain/Transposase zinc-ribbon domain
MNLIEFLDKFPDEKSCKAHFIKVRKSKGVVCKKCSSTEHYWLQNKEQFECKSCKFRTTLRSSTLLQSTKLSYQYWYIAIHLMTATKKGFSAHEMKRQLGHKNYEPIWYMMRKIRIYMGFSDDKSILKDMVELDDAYVSTFTPKSESENLKRGKGSQKKTKVTVMAESIPLEHSNKKSQFVGNYKMKVNKSETKQALNFISQNCIDENAIIFTDKSKSYSDLDRLFDSNLQSKSMDRFADFKLTWVNIGIANVKRFLLGIYHVVKEKCASPIIYLK